MAKTKHVRLAIPEEIHSKLKGSAGFAGKTLAEWILEILAKSVKQTTTKG